MLPLAGVRVIELGRVYAAPWTSMMLADLGADVIKVEDPRGGDMMRALGPGFTAGSERRPGGDSGKFQAVNRNKRSLTVDIATEQGQRIVRDLVRTADVFIENFKVGDLARRGLDYPALSAIRPDLIYLSITGFGQTGPNSKRPAFDAVAQGYSGFMSINGEAGGPPLRSTANLMDFSTGMFGALAITTALLHQRNGGGGQHIDLSMVDAGLSMMSYSIMSAWLAGEQPPRTGSSNVDWVPSGTYACADGEIYIVSGPDKDFERFCAAIDRPDLPKDPRYATRTARNDHRGDIDSLLAEVLPGRTVIDWVDRFEQFGVVSAPVYEFADIPRDPHIRARASIGELAHGAGGSVPIIRNPIRFSSMDAYPEAAAPLLGEHSESILHEELGLDAAQIAALRKNGVI